MDWPKISNVGSKISFQELHDHNSLAYLDDVSNPENDIPKPIRNVPNTVHFTLPIIGHFLLHLVSN